MDNTPKKSPSSKTAWIIVGLVVVFAAIVMISVLTSGSGGHGHSHF